MSRRAAVSLLPLLALAAGCQMPVAPPPRPSPLSVPAAPVAVAPPARVDLDLDGWREPDWTETPRHVTVSRGGLVSIHADDVPVQDVVRELARGCRRNVLVADGVVGRVSLDLEGVRFREALELVARVSKCDIEEIHRPR